MNVASWQNCNQSQMELSLVVDVCCGQGLGQGQPRQTPKKIFSNICARRASNQSGLGKRATGKKKIVCGSTTCRVYIQTRQEIRKVREKHPLLSIRRCSIKNFNCINLMESGTIPI